mgnify:CR=1 FL=1
MALRAILITIMDMNITVHISTMAMDNMVPIRAICSIVAMTTTP